MFLFVGKLWCLIYSDNKCSGLRELGQWPRLAYTRTARGCERDYIEQCIHTSQVLAEIWVNLVTKLFFL